MRMRMLSTAVAAVLVGVAGCSGSFTMPPLTGCVGDADAQSLITRTDAQPDQGAGDQVLTAAGSRGPR